MARKGKRSRSSYFFTSSTPEDRVLAAVKRKVARYSLSRGPQGGGSGWEMVKRVRVRVRIGVVGDGALLLALAGFMVLEPVKHVLALDLAILPEPGGDPLYLVGGGRADAVVVVEVLEDSYLVCRRGPSRAALPAEEAAASATASRTLTATVAVNLVQLLRLFHAGGGTPMTVREQMEGGRGRKGWGRERERERDGVGESSGECWDRGPCGVISMAGLIKT